MKRVDNCSMFKVSAVSAEGGNLCKRGCSFGAVRPPIIIGFLDDYQPKSETTRRITQDPFSLAIWNKV
jgi:hypothetical protein